MNDATEKSAGGQFRLLGSRRFAPLFLTQFLGAFNDNLYKNALVVLLTFHAASWTRLAPEVLTNLAGRYLHPAVLPLFGHRRASRRQVRQGDAGAPR